MYKKHTKVVCTVTDRKRTTRDAVETAIDLAKEDKNSSWESGFARYSNRFPRWQPKEDESKEVEDTAFDS